MPKRVAITGCYGCRLVEVCAANRVVHSNLKSLNFTGGIAGNLKRDLVFKFEPTPGELKVMEARVLKFTAPDLRETYDRANRAQVHQSKVHHA